MTKKKMSPPPIPVLDSVESYFSKLADAGISGPQLLDTKAVQQALKKAK